jgi:hypothetical protein
MFIGLCFNCLVLLGGFFWVVNLLRLRIFTHRLVLEAENVLAHGGFLNRS